MDYEGGMQEQHDEQQCYHQHDEGLLLHHQHHDSDNHFDSSSSSGSDNHSSPAESSYTATSQHDWALDGLSLDMALPWSPGAPSTLAALDPGFAHALTSPSKQANHTSIQHAKESLTLTHDFWNATSTAAESATPSTTADLHAEARNPAADGNRSRTDSSDQTGNGVQTGAQAQGNGAESTQMEFDDMVHGDVCGTSAYCPAAVSRRSYSPATLSSSPRPEPTPSTSTSIPSQTSLAFAATSTTQDASHASFSMPIDLLAVNAGIAPALTSVGDGAASGQATPERFVSPAPESRTSPYMSSTRATSVSLAGSLAQDSANESYSLRRSSAATTRSSRASTREHSVSRASDTSTSSSSAAQHQRAANGSSSKTGAAAGKVAASALGIVNLVARDAVLTSKLIPSAATPSGDEIVAAASGQGQGAPPELLVLGVPTVGAKSRVETQIKITLALVRPQQQQQGIKREEGVDSMMEGGKAGWILPDGGLDERAARDLERVETWTHLRLPRHLALKSKEKKSATGAVKSKSTHPMPEPPAESTLSLEVAVVSASDPSQRIYICSNCEQRELKRSLRRKDSKGKTFTAPIPVPDPGDPPRNEDEEREKVVVFNAQELVDFRTGEVVLPTRVTCYCRHHKEKKGFCITYAVRDHRGNLVAQGLSPAIMITDDHKTNTSKAAAAAAAAAASANVSAAEDSGSKRKGSKSAAAVSSVKSKKEKAPSPPATGRPRRGVSGRSRRGQTETDDEQDSARKSRPYDSDARPSRKRSSNTHRSPMFAMTPLAPMTQQSKPPSPVLDSASFTTTTEAQPEESANSLYGSALGLNGLCDAEMSTPAESAYDSRRSSVGCVSTNGIDWRAGMSTPPLSPHSTAPSVSDTFQSLFSGFPSPSSAIQEAPVIGQESFRASSGSIPSFAIPATEPIPASFAPSWAIQQQPQQLEPPAAPPRINRVIPGEGPVHGGIEVTVLGDNFVRDLTCVFGDNAAVPTHYWSANTLVCVLPPSANPGPVVVGIKGVPLTPDQGSGLQLFTYKDTSDRSLLELALQVVGMQMTGRIEDAAAIAMRIVANGSGGGQGGGSMGGRGSNGNGASGGATDTAALAATLESATRSAYATPTGSQASSRRSSFARSTRPGPPTSELTRIASGETRNFEGIVIKFLSLLDLDPSLIPGAAPSLPSSQPPISLVNQQRHTLLHLAAVLGFHRLVAFLLPRGIALDTADRNGYTALHFAALYGRVAITRLLLEAGANTAVRTLAGRTPLDIAIERDDIDVEDLLVARGAESSHTPPMTPTLSSTGPAPHPSRYSPVLQNRSLPPAGLASRRGSAASTHSRSTFFFEAGEDDSDSDTDYPSDWTVEDDSWDANDDADVDESDSEEVTPLPRSRLASRNASTVSLQYLLAAEAEVEARVERLSPRLRKLSLPDGDNIPLAQPVTRSDVADAPNGSWISQKLRPTAEGVSTAWEKAKANRFGVASMQMPDVSNALQLRGTRRRRATESAVTDETDGNESTATSSSRFSASPFRDWTPAFRAPQWWLTTKAPSSPPPQYTPSDSLALAPAPEKVAFEAPVAPALEPTRTTSFKAIRARVQRRLSSTSHSAAGDSDAETDTGSCSFDAHRPASLTGDVMLFAFWIPVLVVALWFAYRNWAEYVGPVIGGLSETLLPTRVARIFA
ncbi:hypothetical protein JCM10908_005036 [Rhodotorula pacifica]|uniref:uncharacterized protein n=1 Tax=Rhodotorula pacifica TaxID=1495444 RepID=UPI00317742E8